MGDRFGRDYSVFTFDDLAEDAAGERPGFVQFVRILNDSGFGYRWGFYLALEAAMMRFAAEKGQMRSGISGADVTLTLNLG